MLTLDVAEERAEDFKRGVHLREGQRIVRSLDALAPARVEQQHALTLGKGLCCAHGGRADAADDEFDIFAVQHGLRGLGAFGRVVFIVIGMQLQHIGLATRLDAAFGIDLFNGLLRGIFKAETPGRRRARHRRRQADLEGLVGESRLCTEQGQQRPARNADNLLHRHDILPCFGFWCSGFFIVFY